ncbi:MAG: hypothetical protein E6H66_25505 [Betaproteobacteria bacterium]|nr:MAG: hypothetical protein E6H66_25505 [Betaproteobacteria bacterium]
MLLAVARGTGGVLANPPRAFCKSHYRLLCRISTRLPSDAQRRRPRAEVTSVLNMNIQNV